MSRSYWSIIINNSDPMGKSASIVVKRLVVALSENGSNLKECQ